MKNRRFDSLLLGSAFLISLAGATSGWASEPPEADALTFNDLASQEMPLFIDLLSAASDVDGDPLGCRIARLPEGTLTPGPSPCTYLYETNQAHDSFDFEIFQLADPSLFGQATVTFTFLKSSPANPTATATGPYSIRLAWFDVQDELCYEIYGGTDTSSLELLDTVSAAAGGVLYWDHDLDLQPDTTYFYEIDACYVDVCISSTLLSATTSSATGAAPIAVLDSFEVGQGQQLLIPHDQLLDNDLDPNGDPIFFLDSTPLQTAHPTSQNTLHPVPGGFLYITKIAGLLTEDYTDTFSYRISDGTHTSEPATVTLRVLIAPLAQANPDSLVAERGRVLEILYQEDLFENDEGALEPVTLHFSKPQSGRLDFCCEVDRLRYVPNPDFVGTDSFWYSIRGGENSFASAEVTIDVYDSGVVLVTAGVPDLLDLPTKPGPDGKTRLPLVFSDLLLNDHGLDLTLNLPLTIINTPGGGQLTSVTPGHDPPSGPAPVGYEGLLFYETESQLSASSCPPPCAVTDWFRYTPVGQGPGSTGLPANQPFLGVRLIPPEPTSEDPVFAISDVFATAEGERLSIGQGDLLGNDVPDVASGLEPNPLRFGPPVHGLIAKVTSPGGIVYRAPSDFVGIDHFTYAVQIDAHPTTLKLARVIVDVQPGKPTPQDDQASTVPDTLVLIPVLANDTDPPNNGPLTLIAVGEPTLGSAIAGADGRVAYMPPPGITGLASFSYTVEDEVGLQASAVVTVDVRANQDPIAQDDDVTFNPNRGRVVIRPLLNDDDPDGHSLTILGFTQPDLGTLWLEEASILVYEIPQTEQALHPQSFVYTIGDGHGGTATATVLLTPDPLFERR